MVTPKEANLIASVLNPFLLAEAIGWSGWRNVMLGGSPELFPGYNSSKPFPGSPVLLG